MASLFSPLVSGDLRLLSTNTCWYPLCDLHSSLTVTFLTGHHCSFQREDSINLISIVSMGYHVTIVTLTHWPINSGVLTSLLLPHLIIPHRLPAFLESLMPLKNWCSIHARCFKSSLKHSVCFCGIFSKFKTEFIAYHSSEVSDCIFEIHQLVTIGL